MENILVVLLSITILLAINGFFVAAEFSLVKSRGVRMEALADEGLTTARLTLRIHNNLKAYLAACQLGITMASLGLGWVGAPAVAAILEPLLFRTGIPEALLHAVTFITCFILISSLHFVIGGQIPKILAIRKDEPVSLWLAYPVHYYYLLVYPLNWLLNTVTRTISFFIKDSETPLTHEYSDKKFNGLAVTATKHNELKPDMTEVLRNLNEFEQCHVGQMMIPRAAIKLIDVSAAPEKNLAQIRASGHSRFPLIDSSKNEEIIGVVLAKDLYAAMMHADQQSWKKLQNYCRLPLVVTESQNISELFYSMRLKRTHMALVMDKHSKLTGIVTLEDLLEEIVGDIEKKPIYQHPFTHNRQMKKELIE